MKKREFDVVVVGAGFRGMCAAARLAHKGYKTLTIDRLPYLGGRAGSMGRRPIPELADHRIPGLESLYLVGCFQHPRYAVTPGGRATG